MKRLQPNENLKDLPCSLVALMCANEKLNLKDINTKDINNDGYATLRTANKLFRENLQIKKSTYYPRAVRKLLKEMDIINPSIVLVLGHYVYCENNTYYSFFNNDNDSVVQIWEIDK